MYTHLVLNFLVKLTKAVRSFDNKHQGNGILYLVSADENRNQIMLAQIKTKDKSNEIKTIPKL